MKIKLAIVDDHELVRDGLELNLMGYQGFKLIGSAGDYLGLQQLLKTNSPDVILLDLDLPQKSGIEITKELKAEGKVPKILILTGNDQVNYLEQALKAGADGFISKKSSKELIIKGVEAVYNNEIFIDPSLSQDVYTSLKNKLLLANEEQELTPRELDVIKCFANGMTYQEIAGELNVSKKTVEKYKASIFTKLNLSNQAELVKYAVKHNLTTI